MADVEKRHPEYTEERRAEWALCRAAYDGESQIKAAGELYLPKPNGFNYFPDRGKEAYDAYKGRAQFPEIMSPSIGAMIGIIHDQEIKIEMPEGLQYLFENADGEGTTLDDFHRRITKEILVLGRHGILTDAPDGGGDPFFACYLAPTIINWDRDFYVLDESHFARDGFSWEFVKQYRVLELVDGTYQQRLFVDGVEAPQQVQPNITGGGSLDFVPFVIAGAKDLSRDIETPPLIGVARSAKAMYQLSADYRHQLYMSGQETLVAINGDSPKFVGAGAVHVMKGTPDLTPDLKYVGPACVGIEKHLEAMEFNRDAAVQAGARLFEQSEKRQESGEARAMRFRSETANLQTVADSSCAAVERALRFAARIKGLDPSTVIVTPPESLLDQTMSAAEASALWAIARDGGMSYQTFYENIARGGIASPERDHEEEYALIERDPLADEGEDFA